ncbi:MAG TPA: hypothetical protein PKD59_00060 [Miltoncostaeaceae bacterium]|nr:hypothetical protein [Miltoncostaeaceae bacterium]
MIPHAPPRRSRRRSARRIAALTVLAAGAAVALSGCVALKGTSFAQQDRLGPVNVVIKGCASNGTAACPNNTGGVTNNTGVAQALVGISVSATATPPQSFTSDVPDSRQFTFSPSYTAELTRLDPPGAGSKWAGYISDAGTWTPGNEITVRIPVIRGLLPDGSPPGGGFGAGVTLGSRGVVADAPPSRPVQCGSDLSTVNTQDLTICRDASGGASASNAFNEFVFLTPAAVNVAPGATATIPVTGKLGGPANAAVNFALSATTTVPGTVALTNVPTLAPPGDSSTTVVMSVAVPAGTRPGTYQATLTGTLASGEKRSTTATIVVGGGGTTAGGPALSGLTLSRPAVSTRRGRPPALVSASLSQPASVTMLLERRAVGRKKNGACVAPTRALVRARAATCFRFIRVSSSTKANQGAGPVTFSVSGRAAGRARALGTYRVTLTATAGGVAGAPVRAPLRVIF